MEKWEIALQKFLKTWKNKKEVIGIIVCGSYITGNPSNHSDIDLHILLDSKTSWRQRGNKIIDGILIEYFINPIHLHNYYFQDDYKKRKKASAHMFVTGKIILDKTGELGKLVQDAKKHIKKKYSKNTKFHTEYAKYNLWDMCDNLEEVYEANTKDFHFVYYNNLNTLFDTYAKYLQYDSIAVHKLITLLINEKSRKKYHVRNFPDKDFVEMYIDALNINKNSKMIQKFQKLTKHVFTKMGGFNIDGWNIKSSIK